MQTEKKLFDVFCCTLCVLVISEVIPYYCGPSCILFIINNWAITIEKGLNIMYSYCYTKTFIY